MYEVDFMKKRIFGLGLLASMFLSVPASFADCDDIGSNEWEELYGEMSQAINDGTNDIALQYALQLELICKTDPVLLYSISELYNRMGREQESTSYVRRASENLRGHSDIPQAIVEKIWFRRASLELPMRQELADARAENEQLKTQAEASNAQWQTRLNQSQTFANEMIADEVAYLKKLQWAGTGVAIGGAAMAVAGGVLFGLTYANKLKPCNGDKDACSGKLITGNSIDQENGNFGAEMNKAHVGVGLLGAGAALAVGGSILAIISHVKMSEVEIKMTGSESVTLNLDVSPAWAGVTVQF